MRRDIVPQNGNEKGTDARRTELNAPAARVCFARKKAAGLRGLLREVYRGLVPAPLRPFVLHLE